MLQSVCKGLSDPDQHVRNCALFAMGQFSEHLQVNFHILRWPLLVRAFYAPNFEKVGSKLVSAYAFVRSSFRSFKKIQARVLKFHIWIPRQKIAYPYFFLV